MSDEQDILDEETPEGDALDLGTEPESTDDGEAASEAPPQSEGRARGPDGKFIQKTSAEGALEEGADGEAEAEPDVPVVEAPKAPSGRPVPLKVDGQTFELPGALQRDDGVIEVSADGFEHVHRWMGKGIVSDQKIAKLQSQLAEVTERSSAEVEWAKMVGERYAEIAMLPEEEQLEYLRAFRAEFPSLRAQAEAEHWKREAERARRMHEPSPQDVQAQREGQFANSFNENFTTILQSPWAKGLTQDDQAQLKRELEAVADSFLWIADRDYPEHGFSRGEWVFNDQKMAQAIQARADYLNKIRVGSAKVNSAAQKNAAARATQVVAPPVAAPKKVTQSTSSTPNKPKTRDEWHKQNLY